MGEKILLEAHSFEQAVEFMPLLDSFFVLAAANRGRNCTRCKKPEWIEGTWSNRARRSKWAGGSWTAVEKWAKRLLLSTRGPRKRACVHTYVGSFTLLKKRFGGGMKGA